MKVLGRIKKWRELVQNSIRSTFIGFPVKPKRISSSCSTLEEAQLDRVGCFQYSPADGAPANDLPDQIPDDIKQQR